MTRKYTLTMKPEFYVRTRELGIRLALSGVPWWPVG